MKSLILNDLKEIGRLIEELQENDLLIDQVLRLIEEVVKTFANENKVLICGNGGSSTDAMHFAEEFTGRFRKDRRALPVIALTDPSHLTCVANDYGYDAVFSRAVEAFGNKGDLLIAISTSGNSANILKAVKKAAAQDMGVFCLSGKTGGKLKKITDNILIFPGKETDRIQELHGAVLHIVIEMVERVLFPENY